MRRAGLETANTHTHKENEPQVSSAWLHVLMSACLRTTNDHLTGFPTSSPAVQHTGWNGCTAAHWCLGTIVQRLCSHLSTAPDYKVKRARVQAPQCENVLSAVLLFPRIMRNTRTWAGHAVEVVTHASPAKFSAAAWLALWWAASALVSVAFFFFSTT